MKILIYLLQINLFVHAPCQGKFFNITLSGGLGKITSKNYAKCIQKLKPDIMISVGDVVHPKEGNIQKRLTKSHQRTLEFLSDLLEQCPNECIWATLTGGLDLEMRKKSSLELSLQPVSGFVIPLLPQASLNPLTQLSASLEHLPLEKPVLVYGIKSFIEIVEAVGKGVDLFDGILPFTFTEKGHALILEFTSENEAISIDLNEDQYFDDTNPLVCDCACWTCQHHSRSYVHHLLKTHEMLAPILLQIHNIHWMNLFMRSIRCTIQMGTWEKDAERFCASFQY